MISGSVSSYRTSPNMEEQAQEKIEAMDLKHPRKLNFNAPLLSTRRLGFSVVDVADTCCSSNSLGTLQITSVPFSWEQAPGKPKGMERSDSDSILGGDTPRPRPPPRLWHPPKVEESKADVSNNVLAFDQDDGCDGDDDDDDGDDDKKNDVYKDAMDDVLSLSEALDIVQQSETNHSGIHDGGLRLKLAGSNNGDQSPTYMINRFLPDATALAASSAAQFSGDLSKEVCDTCSYPEDYLSGSARHSYASCSSSPKGCGLELLFPRRMRHKLCAIKSPVLTCSTNVQKNQHSSKNMKRCSSVHHRT